MPLTDIQIRSLKATDKEQKHFDGGGLYLSIPKTGRKLWRMAYRFDQKTKLLSFGEYPIITLKDARQRRDEAKKLLANGIDPGAQKKAAKEEQISEVKDTVQSIALEWHDNQPGRHFPVGCHSHKPRRPFLVLLTVQPGTTKSKAVHTRPELKVTKPKKFISNKFYRLS